MRLCLLACLAAALFANGTAARAADPVHNKVHTLPLLLPTEARMKQVFVHTKTIDTGAAVKSATTTAEYLNAIDAGFYGYTVTKSMTRFNMTSGDAASAADAQLSPQDKLNAVVARMSGMDKVVFAADASLSPVSIDNWEEVKANASAELGTTLGKDSQSVVDSVFGMFDAAGAASAFLREDNLIAIPHNVGLLLNQPLQQTSDAPAPVGDGILTFDVTLALTGWDEAAGEAVVVYDSRPQTQSLHTFVTEFGPQLLTATQANVKEADMTALFDKMKIEKSTHCSYTMDIKTGLVKHGDCTVISGVELPGQKQITTETYNLSESLVE